MSLEVLELVLLSLELVDLCCIYMPHRKDLVLRVLVLHFALRRLKQVLEVTHERSPKVTSRDFLAWGFLHRAILKFRRSLDDIQGSERISIFIRGFLPGMPLYDPSWLELNLMQATLATCCLIIEVEGDDKVEEIEEFVLGEAYVGFEKLCDLYKKTWEDPIDRSKAMEGWRENAIFSKLATDYQKEANAWCKTQVVGCLWDKKILKFTRWHDFPRPTS